MHSFLNDNDRDRGYTLLELLLALTLTVLLVLAGSYGWRQHQSARQLASSAHQLLDFIVCQQWHAAWGALLQIVDGDKLIAPFADGVAHEPIQWPLGLSLSGRRQQGPYCRFLSFTKAQQQSRLPISG